MYDAPISLSPPTCLSLIPQLKSNGISSETHCTQKQLLTSWQEIIVKTFFGDLSLGSYNDVYWTKDNRWEQMVNVNGFCKIVWSPDPNFPNIANHWRPRVPADFHTCQTFPLLTDLYANCHLPPPSLHTLPTLAPNHVNQRQARFLSVFTLYL